MPRRPPRRPAQTSRRRSKEHELRSATVYFDHPYHAPYEHTLNIDFANEELGPGSRVAVELSAESARELVRCIEAALPAAGSMA